LSYHTSGHEHDPVPNTTKLRCNPAPCPASPGSAYRETGRPTFSHETL